jgi:hypothetical protein
MTTYVTRHKDGFNYIQVLSSGIKHVVFLDGKNLERPLEFYYEIMHDYS